MPVGHTGRHYECPGLLEERLARSRALCGSQRFPNLFVMTALGYTCRHDKLKASNGHGSTVSRSFGSNVTATPSGAALRIAAASQGGELPASCNDPGLSIVKVHEGWALFAVKRCSDEIGGFDHRGLDLTQHSRDLT